MNSGKVKFILLFFAVCFATVQSFAQTTNHDETLQQGLKTLKKYFLEKNNWLVVRPSVGDDVGGLIDYIENDPVDTIIYHLGKTFSQDEIYVFRLPENVEDSLSVDGYFSADRRAKRADEITTALQNEYNNKKIDIPNAYLSNLTEKLPLVPEGKGARLFTDSVYVMPAKLQIPEVIPDSLLSSPGEFQELIRTDSTRNVYIEQKRKHYNDSIISGYIDSVRFEIRNRQYNEALRYGLKKLADSVKVNNYNLLRAHNEMVVQAVNDTVQTLLETFAVYADFIDSSTVKILNLTGRETEIMLQNNNERFGRVWLKNVQNDSLSVLVKTIDKNTMQMFIDDGVTISRYKARETKDFDFNRLEKSMSSLNKVGKSYELYTPWVIGGVGSIGFSQTYLDNWKKGGKSAISSLIVLKGFANYTRADAMVKWENSAEFRNGWLRPGGKGTETQKNDDRVELTSRFGVSAFKKWYYSAELNFETQLFKGYNYPRAENPDPISAFWAPARTFFKVGMEYKPNKDFSLLLSPFTLKNVYVRDTALIDQTNFGVAKNRKSFWEPGFNADVFVRKKLRDNIMYETKYKMFFNYKAPFTKFDINWENNLVVKLTEYVDMKLLVHLIYDDNVLFPVYNDKDEVVGEKAKLQVKEYFSIGFSYSLNHKVMHSKRLR